MKESEMISLTEHGCVLAIEAGKFTYAEIRQMARSTRKSSGMLSYTMLMSSFLLKKYLSLPKRVENVSLSILERPKSLSPLSAHTPPHGRCPRS